MTIKTHEEVVAQAKPDENLLAKDAVRAAATAAAEIFAPDEVEKHAQAILDVWVAKMKEQTRAYTRQAMAQTVRTHETVTARGEGPELSFISGTPPYAWFDLVCAGPFQIAPGGAYLPHKVIQVNEAAFMLGALWRNPAPINFIQGNPSAADMMAALDFSVWFEGVNLTTVSDGPDFLPFIPIPTPIGGGFLNGIIALMPPGTFPTPPQGKPHLYELNMTVDVTGPGVVPAALPFSGFATWQFDPDQEPPFLSPVIQIQPQWQHDVPTRFLVHS